MRTFNSVKELFDLLDNADPNGDVILAIEDIHQYLDVSEDEDVSEDVVVFVPLGHRKYLQLFRNLSHPNCHPTSYASTVKDFNDLGTCSAKVWDTACVARYIARSFFENTYPGTNTRATLFIAGNEYFEGEGLEVDVEKMIDEEGF